MRPECNDLPAGSSPQVPDSVPPLTEPECPLGPAGPPDGGTTRLRPRSPRRSVRPAGPAPCRPGVERPHQRPISASAVHAQKGEAADRRPSPLCPSGPPGASPATRTRREPVSICPMNESATSPSGTSPARRGAAPGAAQAQIGRASASHRRRRLDEHPRAGIRVDIHDDASPHSPTARRELPRVPAAGLTALCRPTPSDARANDWAQDEPGEHEARAHRRHGGPSPIRRTGIDPCGTCAGGAGREMSSPSGRAGG